MFDFISYNWFDWSIVGVCIVSMVVSMLRGFVREALALTAWGVAIWIAYAYAYPFSDYLIPHISTPSIRIAVTVIGVFVVVLLCSSMLRVMLLFVIQASGLRAIDHVLGAIFGLIRGMVIVVLMVVLLQKIHFSEDDWWKKSVLVPHVKKLVNEVPKHLPKKLSSLWTSYLSNSFVVTESVPQEPEHLAAEGEMGSVKSSSQNNT